MPGTLRDRQFKVATVRRVGGGAVWRQEPVVVGSVPAESIVVVDDEEEIEGLSVETGDDLSSVSIVGGGMGRGIAIEGSGPRSGTERLAEGR